MGQIDKHTKKRALLIDDSILLNPIVEDYIYLLIDICELSNYYDCIIVAEKENMQNVIEKLDHECLVARVVQKYSQYDQLKNKYRFLLAICNESDKQKVKQFYRCEVLTR